MPHSLFGTDGIRGTAGTYPLDAATIRRVGAALVKVMLRNRQKPGGRVLIGRDTRESGEWIERELAFDTTVLAATPDGRNINSGCGSTHPELLAKTVRSDGYRLGVAFDGDGDRAIFADAQGRVLDGDHVLLMCGRQMKAEGRLRGNAVFASVMINIGLELGLKKHGIDLVRTTVGDKYVMEEMQKRNLALGGEQSGHIIFSDFLYTGDGLITALNVLRTMAATGKELAELAAELQTYPQVLLNVRVNAKPDLKTVPKVAVVIDEVDRKSVV